MCPWSMDLLPDQAVAETMGVLRGRARADTRGVEQIYPLYLPLLSGLVKSVHRPLR